MALIAQVAEANKISQSRLAELAFGDDESSPVRWRKMRRENKPQKLTLAESMMLCRALGLDYIKFLVRVDLCVESNACPLNKRQKPTRRSA